MWRIIMPFSRSSQASDLLIVLIVLHSTLSEAFDTADHNILLNTLLSVGFNDSSYNWFTSDLW